MERVLKYVDIPTQEEELPLLPGLYEGTFEDAAPFFSAPAQLRFVIRIYPASDFENS